MVTNDLDAAGGRSGARVPPLPGSPRSARPTARRTRAWGAVAATAGLTITLLTSGTSLVRFAYASIPLHVAVEIVAAMASAVAAQLAYGRFRQTLELHDLLLVAALLSFAAANLLFGAVPAVFDARPERFATWAPVGGTLVSTALLAAAAFAPARAAHRPRVASRRAILAAVGGLALVAAVVFIAGDAMPPAVAPHATPNDVDGPRIATDPAVLSTQVLAMLLFAAAAAGFAGRDSRSDDVMARWLAVGATFGAFARLNYALFPSLYTQWFYAGDALRLGCFVAIFTGAVLETRRLQSALGTAAVISERQRIARDVHDGIAQDLAFIVQQLRELAERDATPRLQRLVRAAERALDESRHAVAALMPAPDRPLAEVLAATAREAGEREGSVVETDLSAELAVPPRVRAELLRIAREAVINAARHGRARRIHVALLEQPQLCLEISDDGLGFDVEAASLAHGRRGLAGMRERVHAIGGELTVTSEPGRGTQIRVTVP
jgi:signal transduction histidine kinase